MFKKSDKSMNVKSKKRREFLSGLQFEQLEKRELLAGDLGAAMDVGEGEAGGAQIGYPVTSLTGSDYLSGYSLGKMPMEVATEYLGAHSSDFGLEADDLNDYRLLSQFVSPHTRVTHIVLQQQHNGLDVFGSMINIAVDNDGRIIAGGSSFVPGLSSQTEAMQTAQTNAVGALGNVFSSLGLTPTTNVEVLSQSGEPNQAVLISDGGVASQPISGGLGYIYNQGDLELAWVFSIPTADGAHSYAAFASAETGDYMMALDGVMNAVYSAFDFPVMNPDQGSQQNIEVLTDPTSPSPFGWHDTNGVPGPEFTDTRGNNVFVQSGAIDAEPPNSNGVRAEGGEGLEFVYPYNPNLPATAEENVLASTTNVFYTLNVVHDVMATYGFDEAAGNYQATNYTGLGVDGDALQVDVTDPGPDALCNALFYSIPSPSLFATVDGDNNMIEMGYCNRTDPTRDSGFDNDIILHEFGHALIGRLVGGPFWMQGAVDEEQSGAIHEGGADYLSLLFGMQATDTPETPKWDKVWYFGDEDKGIRRQPYSYDMSIGDKTFENWNEFDDTSFDPPRPNAQQHNAGEIVASMLYDMTWELIFKYGGVRDASAMDIAFEEDISRAVGRTNAAGTMTLDTVATSMLGPDLLDLGTGANNLAMQLFVDGLKYTTTSLDGPTFTGLRDGILAADIALTGGVNHDALWRAFARRGLGGVADAGLPDTVPIQTSYALPTTPAHIAGTAFVDGDADGVRDTFEAPLAGVNIYMDLNDNGTHERLEPWMTTDEDGNYSFELYVGGPFSIKALPMDNYLQTLPTTVQVDGMPVNDGGHDVYVVTGASAAGVDFGFTVSDVNKGIFGTKFNDLNSNRAQDPGELGIADVYIYLDLDNDKRIDIGEPATKTLFDGSYYIDYNVPGPVIVREVISPGFEQTAPADNAGHEITLVAGLPYLGVDFGNHEVRDYGDLPDTFNLNDAPSHGLLDNFNFYLGAGVDAEVGSIDGNAALGDDNNSVDATGFDDEDGVEFVDEQGVRTRLVRGHDNVTLKITANSDVGTGLVSAWIDFNQNGIFDVDNPYTSEKEYSELVINSHPMTNGDNYVPITIPQDAELGATYARFRYSNQAGIGPTGAAFIGEVEDYRLDPTFGGGIIDDKPYAYPDSYTTFEGATGVPLEVLENDYESTFGEPSLISPDDPLGYDPVLPSGEITTEQGGTAVFNDTNGTIYYTPATDFSGTDTFTYKMSDKRLDGNGNPILDDDGLYIEISTAVVTVHVQPQFISPEAVDDYQVVTDTSVGGQTVIDVLANDIAGNDGVRNFTSWTNGSHGSVELITDTDGVEKLRYTRTDADAYTLDSFTYTIADNNPNHPSSTANVTVELAENVDTIEYIVEAMSPFDDQATTTAVTVENQFKLRVSVKDSRTSVTPAEAGVYAGYVDLLYDTEYLQVVPGTLVPSSTFPDIASGDSGIPGIVNEAGGVQDGVDQELFSFGSQQMELFTIEVIALAPTLDSEGLPNSTSLQTDPADSSPLHDTVVIAPAPAAKPGLEINYRSFDLQILGGGEGEALLDTNGDGAVTPIDALGVINQLNEFGSSAVAEGETAGLDRSFDVNRDSFVSPLDALEIINYLNEQALDMGEGEGIEIVEQSTIDTTVAGNEIAATEAVQADVIDEFLRVRENEIGLAYFTGGSHDVVQEDTSDLDSAIDELADDVFGQWK